MRGRSTKQPNLVKCVLELPDELTLRLRDECDLAEADEVRGAALDTAVALMLIFDELVGWT